MDSIGYHTEQGRPSYQQDLGSWLEIASGTASCRSHHRALLIFDGNQTAGGIAAEVACEAAKSHLVVRLTASASIPNRQDLLSECLRIANRAVCAAQLAVPAANRSGTTGTIVLLSDDELSLAYVGDSPVLVLENRRLRSLVRDHTLAEELVAAGKATREQVVGLESILTKCLGMEEVVTPTAATIQAKRPAIVIAGTDGALRALGVSGTAEVLRGWLKKGSSSAQELAADICREAIRRGSEDNASAGVMVLPPTESPATDEGELTVPLAIGPLLRLRSPVQHSRDGTWAGRGEGRR